MSLYHEIAILVKTELGHWNRSETVDLIDKVCKRLVKTSQIRKYLLESKDFIQSDNLSAAKERLEYVKNMDNLEQIIKNDEKHFNFKKALVTAATILSFGLMHPPVSKANQENIYFSDGKTTIQAYVRDDRVYNQKDNSYLGYVFKGRIVVNNPSHRLLNENPVYFKRGQIANNNASNNLQNQSINEKISNIQDHLKNAGQELSNGNYQKSEKMYSLVIQQSQEKKIKVSRNQLYQSYMGFSTSLEKAGDLNGALFYYKQTFKKFPEEKYTKKIIQHLENKLRP